MLNNAPAMIALLRKVEAVVLRRDGKILHRAPLGDNLYVETAPFAEQGDVQLHFVMPGEVPQWNDDMPSIVVWQGDILRERVDLYSF